MSTLHLLISFFSLLFFYVGVRRFLTAGHIGRIYSFFLVAYGLVYLLYALFYAVSYYFTGKGIDYSVLYHVKYGLTGAGYGEYGVLIFCGILFLFLSVITFCFFIFSSSVSSSFNSRSSYLLAILLLLLSGIVHPATADLYMLSRTGDGESFWKYYRTPFIHSSGEIKKNFIFIYAESLERTYFDELVFPGLIKELRKIESKSISFSNIGQYPETGWTIAGMVASQCGLPLISPSHGNSMEGMDTFLSGADCMGDLLDQEGYHLGYMGGASLEFAGKGKFYRSHGFSEVLGRSELIPRLPDSEYKNDWGLYDDSLFDMALQKVEELFLLDQPFGLFLLTLDTHGSENNFSKSCKEIRYSEGKNGMLNAVACSDYLISDFIRRLQQLPKFKNTVIIVASDHKAMRNSAYGMLKKSRKRGNLFFIIDPDVESGVIVADKGSTLDIGPTVLSVLGFESYLGLGRNLLQGELSILKEVEHIDTTLKGWRKDIMKFWSFPEINEGIIVNSRKKAFQIDDRTFSLPVLIQYDDDLQVKMWFDLYNAPVHKTLLQNLKGFKSDTPFILVNACKRLPKEWTGGQVDGFCMASGKLGSTEMRTEHIVGSVQFTAKQLKKILGTAVSEEMYSIRIKQATLATKKNKKH